MKKLATYYLSTLMLLMLFGCQPDEIIFKRIVDPTANQDSIVNEDSTPTENTVLDGDTITVASTITGDVTWTSGNTYILNDLVVVTGNATLTIEPCVVVKAANGATGLIIDQGSKLDAQGTSTCPIIFTSITDSLRPGEIVSPNLTGADHGLWGGIFILGEAPVSSMMSPSILPQLPQPSPNTYGGVTPSDASGSLDYVSIRHTGYETATDETPCGLTLAGVGSGTMIDHIELFANSDDGFVVLGGTVNVSNVITSSFGDDGFDCDKGYAGTMDNLIGIGGGSRNSSLELDGGEGADNPTFTIKNSSFKGGQDREDYIDFQQNVNCLIENSYFFGFDSISRVKLGRDMDADNWLSNSIDVINLQFNTSHLTTGNLTISSIFVDAGMDANDAFATRTPDASVVTTPTTGANKTVFEGWTVADLTGALNDF